jgi:UDPglucose 6-dehydrogenase
MKIGFIGLGKLGLPVALAVESRGHEVKGYDTSSDVRGAVFNRVMPHEEARAQELLERSAIEIIPVDELVGWADILFLAVQTPHQPQFAGDVPLPPERADFDYRFLTEAVSHVAAEASYKQKDITLVVISTCLPGTFEAELRHLLNSRVRYVYSPLYTAMGTVIADYLDPEFWLIGAISELSPEVKSLSYFYHTIADKPHVVTDVGTAEFIKVAYNTFISAKIMLANAWMQVCHRMGLNVDDVTLAMSHCTKRLLSSAYLTGGGPDGGSCHPRDLIALAWLGQQLGCRPNLFDRMARIREEQTDWTAELILEHRRDDEPVYVLGRAFKPKTSVTTGSGATLLVNLLKDRHGVHAVQYDPHTDSFAPEFRKGLYFVATRHEEFRAWKFPQGSIVLDQWRYLPPQQGVTIIPIGAPMS